MSNLVIPDGGNIGSASDTDAIAISSGGNVTLSQTLDGGAIGSAVTMSANQACVKTALNASGNAGIFAIRASVSFDGQGTPTTDWIRSQQNVSSITNNYDGDYTVNLTNAMPSADYSFTVTLGMITNTAGPVNNYVMANRNKQSGSRVANTTTAIRFNTYSDATTLTEFTDVYVIITG